MSFRADHREAIFVREFLVDLNAKAASIRAGYSPNLNAYKLTRRPNVAAAIAKGMAKRAAKIEITADRVLAELAKIGFADIREAYDGAGNPLMPHDLPDNIAGAISSIEVIQRRAPGDEKRVEEVHKFRLADKRAALVDIGKHIGMFKDGGDDGKDQPQPVTVIINGIDMSKPASEGEPAAS